MANSTTGPTKQEIEAVFARLRSQAANKVMDTIKGVPNYIRIFFFKNFRFNFNLAIIL